MLPQNLLEKVKYCALLSRIIILLFQVVANFLIPDHEADAFISPPDPHLPHKWLDTLIEFLFSGMIRWDAHYFMHIAQYGYTHENTLVFFPLFPMIVRGIATVIHLPLQFICNMHSCLIISAIFLNNILFVKSAIILFKFSKEVLDDDLLAYRSALLFCINPASVFFSAIYSESLYCFLIFSALLSFETKNSFITPMRFCLASAVRSNGLVNIGFVIYSKLKDCKAYFNRIRNAATEYGKVSCVLVIILALNYTLIPLLLGCIIIMLPFVLFQFWSYYIYCQEEGTNLYLPPHLELYLRSNFLHSPDLGVAEWCYNPLPVAYAHIQDKYWEVGVFKYYEMKQIPNFILALPVVMAIICQAALYMVDNPHVCFNLGIPSHDSKNKEDYSERWEKKGIDSYRVFVYTVHSLALCLFCVLCIHVQVTTRLLCSSSPIVYWFCAHLTTDNTNGYSLVEDNKGSPKFNEVGKKKNTKYKSNILLFSDFDKSFWSQVVLSYFTLYFVLGTILFSNFLPWT